MSDTSDARGPAAQSDPLNERPDVHDFDACLARSAANVARAQTLGRALFSDGDDTAEAATDALARAIRALEEARAALAFANVRRRLQLGFGDVAALDPAEFARVLELANLPSLVVHVDRRARLRVGEGGIASWTVSRDMSAEALTAMVAEMREHLPDFLKNA